MGRSLRAHLLNASRGTKRVALGTIRSYEFITIMTICRRLSSWGMSSLEQVKQNLTRIPSSCKSQPPDTELINPETQIHPHLKYHSLKPNNSQHPK